MCLFLNDQMFLQIPDIRVLLSVRKRQRLHRREHGWSSRQTADRQKQTARTGFISNQINIISRCHYCHRCFWGYFVDLAFTQKQLWTQVGWKVGLAVRELHLEAEVRQFKNWLILKKNVFCSFVNVRKPFQLLFLVGAFSFKEKSPTITVASFFFRQTTELIAYVPLFTETAKTTQTNSGQVRPMET